MQLPVTRISAELRAPLLVMLIVVPLLAVAGLRVHDAVEYTNAYQDECRVAQITRGRVLRYQLDEETGIRGYLSTGDRHYLGPYEKAKYRIRAGFAELDRTLAPLDISGVEELGAREQSENARWVSDVAEPLLTVRTPSPEMLALMRRGKQLVDTFRADDDALQRRLDAAAVEAARKSERAISNLLIFVFGALIVVTGAVAVFGWYQGRAARTAFENRVRYENQKRIADELQEAFLNRNLPSAPNLGLHATYMPASSEAQVGGDWYDAFELPDKRILFSIGDVAGHGLQAAIVMSRARQAIIAAALNEHDPGRVLERANQAILLQESRMVTAICGYIDPATFEVVYATAGHPPPIIVSPGAAAAYLPYAGMPLGIQAHETYRTFVAAAVPGAVLVLYTDGVIEHKRDVIDGQARLLEATQLAASEDDPARAIGRRIFATVPPTDDVAILTVTFRAPEDTAGIATVGALQSNRLEFGAQSVPPPESHAPPGVDDGEPPVAAALPAPCSAARGRVRRHAEVRAAAAFKRLPIRRPGVHRSHAMKSFGSIHLPRHR